MRFREGKVSTPFYADLLSGGLEDAARAQRPILQSIGPTKPASKKNTMSKYNKFLHLFLVHLFSLYNLLFSSS
jgi:hypothetical protein